MFSWLAFENGVLVFENGVLAFENGHLTNRQIGPGRHRLGWLVVFPPSLIKILYLQIDWLGSNQKRTDDERWCELIILGTNELLSNYVITTAYKQTTLYIYVSKSPTKICYVSV